MHLRRELRCARTEARVAWSDCLRKQRQDMNAHRLVGLLVAMLVSACGTLESVRLGVPVSPARDSVALPLLQRLAGQRGFRLPDSPPPWTQGAPCYVRDTNKLACARADTSAIFFSFYVPFEYGVTSSPVLDSLRAEIADSLAARFGSDKVSRCRWHYVRSRQESECRKVPAAPAKGSPGTA